MSTVIEPMVDTGVRVGELGDAGRRVVMVSGIPIMLLKLDDRVYATDSRCPHMGYPLTKGTVEDGLLRCHWHHWRFDLESGGCFTQGGDDVPTYDTRVDAEGRIFVRPEPRGHAGEGQIQHAWTRLEEGIRERRSFLRARSLVTLAGQGVTPTAVAERAAQVALTYNAAGVGSGLVVLTGVLNVLPALSGSSEEAVLGLSHGLRHIAMEMSGRAPKRPDPALPDPRPGRAQLRQWFLAFLEERETTGAERVLRTFLADGGAAEEALLWLLEAATRHVFLSTGHVLDFLNKARELIRHLGADSPAAAEVLVGMLRPIADATRHEEDLDWQDLLPAIQMAEKETGAASAPRLNAELLLGNDVTAMARALGAARQAGVPIQEQAAVLAEAAVRRLGRFPVANADDWDAVHHLVTYANGVLGLAMDFGGRSPEGDRSLFRAVVHGAMYCYLNRFLNLPRHYLPGEHGPVAPAADPEAAAERLLEAMANGETDEAAGLAAALDQASAPGRVEALWIRAVWREDAGFHALQAVDAALSLERRLVGRVPRLMPVLAGLRFTTAQRDRRLVEWETATALKLARGEHLVDPE